MTRRAGAEYDPSARSALWEHSLREISDDDDDWVNYMQRLGGYTATGDASQDKWFIKHGKDGREGKGTIDGAWGARARRLRARTAVGSLRTAAEGQS